MKMNFAKLKKLTIAKTITTIIFSISLVFCNTISAFASTSVDQETLYPILKAQNNSYVYNATTTTSTTIYRQSTITDILQRFSEYNTLNQRSIYQKVNSISLYVDDIETRLSSVITNLTSIIGYVDGVETGITNINTNLTNIKSYVDGLEGYLDGVEGYIDGLETAFTTNNTRLNEIKTAISNITTYNYSSVLSDILTNTGYLSTIDTYTQSIQDSIGYGTTGDNVLSKLTSLVLSNSEINDDVDDINTNVSDIKTNFDYTPVTFNVLTHEYNYSNPSVYSVNGIPYLSRDFSGTYDINYINGSKTTTNGLLDIINKNIFMSANSISTPRAYYYNDLYDPTTNLVTRYPAYSLMDVLTLQFNNIGKDIKKLTYVIADDDTISAKLANKNQEQTVLTNFTGQGSASASANDFGDVASGVASVNSGLNTGVSISNIFNIYNNRDGYGFWSVETQNELNTTNASRNYKSNRGSSTPLYDSKLSEIYSYMGVNND